MRVAFAGTPEFARTALACLHDAAFEIALVLSQPDRPAGRGLKVLQSPVKTFAVGHGIEVVQPRSLRLDGRFADEACAAQAALRAAAPEVIVVAAYGLLLPEWALAAAPLGCINVHASLLPRWRGAAPIQRAVEAGDDRTGVTIMQMDTGLDTGAMLRAEAVAIEPGDSAATLQTRLAEVGGALLVRTLGDLARGPLVGVPQPAAGVTYAHKIEKGEAAIDWRDSAVVIERRLRAFDPFPGARGTLDGEVITCWRAMSLPGGGSRAGEVLEVDASAVTVACGEGSLALTELQRAGGRRMSAAEFLRGRPVRPGAVFEPRPDRPPQR